MSLLPTDEKEEETDDSVLQAGSLSGQTTKKEEDESTSLDWTTEFFKGTTVRSLNWNHT